jgi:hypothetical protein
MAVVTVQQRSSLESLNRLDSQYYQPHYLEMAKILDSTSPLLLNNISKEIKSYGAYDLTNYFEYKNEGIPYIRCINVKNGYVDFSEILKIDKEANTLLFKSEIEPGYLLLSMSGSIGNTAVASSFWNYPINSNQDVAKIVLQSGFSPHYVSFFLNCKYGRFQTERMPVGSIQQHLFLWQIALLKIPLFHKLQDIIHDLGGLFNKILDKVDNLRNKGESIINSEFDFSTKMDFRHKYIVNYSHIHFRNRLDSEHFLPKYELLRKKIHEYPDGFIRIVDIAENSTEKNNPKEKPENEIEYVELSNINESIGTIEDSSRILGKDAPSRARMVLHKGDVIASSVEGSLDKVALVPEEYDGAIGSTGFFVLRPRNIEPGYLLALMRSDIVKEQMRCEASGTILTAVPAQNLKNIIVPDISKQKREEIHNFVIKAHEEKKKAIALIEKGKRAVEMAIEEGEEKAIEFLNC